MALPIIPAIACQAAYHADFPHGDPADGIITATALHDKALLLTCDTWLR